MYCATTEIIMFFILLIGRIQYRGIRPNNQPQVPPLRRSYYTRCTTLSCAKHNFRFLCPPNRLLYYPTLLVLNSLPTHPTRLPFRIRIHVLVLSNSILSGEINKTNCWNTSPEGVENGLTIVLRGRRFPHTPPC